MEKLFNPFRDFGIATYEQYKLYPFLVFGALRAVQERLSQQIEQIKNGYIFSERVFYSAEKGLGKTSLLFFIKDMLEEGGIECFYFSKLIESNKDIEQSIRMNLSRKFSNQDILDLELKEQIKNLYKKPVYILIDFPDSYELSSLKKFMMFVWNCMTSENYNKINFVFAMNEKHVKKAEAVSEVLGKFLGLRLSKLNLEETKLLIESRTKLIGKVHKDIFNEEVTSMIYQYSKGIPRNVISACNLLFTSNGRIITKDYAEGLLKEKYIERLIDDRIEDLEQRRIYKTMVLILKEKFGGKADSQEDYINRVREVLDIGRNKVMKYIDEMTKNGILSLNRGGYNRINKIISIGEETE